MDPAGQARRWQEFFRQSTEECSEPWQEAFHAFIEFQKDLCVQYNDALKDASEDLDKFRTSEHARSMMSMFLSATTFQRKQAEALLHFQRTWNDKYREFLDGLDDNPKDGSDAQA
jgi:hypothetical protein